MNPKPNLSATLCFGLLLAFAGLRSHAETFYGPTLGTNRIIIKNNECILIDQVRPYTDITSEGGAVPEISTSLIVSNVSYSFAFPLGTSGPDVLDEKRVSDLKAVPCGIAGPAELVVSDAVILHFTRVKTPAVKNVLLPLSRNKADITVPAGKTIQLLWPFFASDEVQARRSVVVDIAKGFSVMVTALFAGDIVNGPCTITFHRDVDIPEGENSALISYRFITEPK